MLGMELGVYAICEGKTKALTFRFEKYVVVT